MRMVRIINLATRALAARAGAAKAFVATRPVTGRIGGGVAAARWPGRGSLRRERARRGYAPLASVARERLRVTCRRCRKATRKIAVRISTTVGAGALSRKKLA